MKSMKMIADGELTYRLIIDGKMIGCKLTLEDVAKIIEELTNEARILDS